MKSIYITDLDHTFLRSDQSISDFSTAIWNDKSQHSILSIATARSFQKSYSFLLKLRLLAPMILFDGSMTVLPDKTLIDIKILNREIGNAVIAEGAIFGIYPFIMALKDMNLNEVFLFPRTLNTHQNAVLRSYKDDSRIVECADIRAMELNLKMIYFADYTILYPLMEHLKKRFGSALEYKLSPEKYSDGWFLTVLHPEGDKAHALGKVLEYLERDYEDVTVFGDSINDIGMFKLAGTAVAVSNALDEVKALADIVLEYSNDEDGVAKYLENI